MVLFTLKVIVAAFPNAPLLPIPYKLAVLVGKATPDEVVTVNGLLPDTAPNMLPFSAYPPFE